MATIVPTVETIGDEALTNSIIDRSITEIQDVLTTVLKVYAFRSCVTLEKAVFGAVTRVNDSTFYGCLVLKTVDLHVCSHIASGAFNGCNALEALIIRTGTMCVLSSTTGLNNTGIANGTGYIYVPAALVDSYKADTNWSSYESQIRAIEDYPEVCGTAGKVWAQASGISEKGTARVMYANGVWVAAGRSSNGIYYSEDGKSWISSNVKTTSCHSLYHRGDWWYAGTAAGVYRSSDGKAWSLTSLRSETRVICFSPDFQLFIAGTTAGLYYSEDGESWTQGSGSTGQIRTIVCANGMCVAGSTGKGLWYSEDGKTWTQSSLTGFYQVHGFANGVWVAGAASGTGGVLYSEDGKTWTKSNLNYTSGIAAWFSNNLWVAVVSGSSQKGIYYSEDGKTWTQSNITTSVGTTAGITWGEGVWIAASYGFGLYYSLDGKVWAISSKTDGYFQYVAYEGGVFFGCENSGLWYSE